MAGIRFASDRLLRRGEGRLSHRRTRLLVLASTYPRWAGDAEPGFVHELCKRLVPEFDVAVSCPHAAGAKRREVMDGVEVFRYRYAPDRFETLVNDGGIVTNLRRQPWKYLLVPGLLASQCLAAWWLRRRLRPQVVHAHWIVPQGLVALVTTRLFGAIPFLVTSHGADLFALKGKFWDAMKRLVARRAARMAVVSRTMREQLLLLGVDTEKIVIEPMGVDLGSRFTPDPNVPRARHEILFVGRLVEKKGLQHLIAAMPSVLSACPQASLRVVGFGPLRDECEAQAKALGVDASVRFRGAMTQDELVGEYRRATVLAAPFVASSSGDEEGLGLVLLEAAGCGCPIIAGDVAAVRDVIDDQDVGTLVPSGDVAALAKAIIARIELGPDSLEATTRRRAKLVAFDWPERARAYGDLLRRCAR